MPRATRSYLRSGLDLLSKPHDEQVELSRLRAENERLRAVLQWLDRLGGLGLDKHERIQAALAGKEQGNG